jgi:hypothetical protein
LSIVFEEPTAAEDEADTVDEIFFDKNFYDDSPDRALECILIDEELVNLQETNIIM